MSNDANARKKARQARMDAESGDMTAAKSVAVRGTSGIAGFLETLADQWIYLEGARMNYRGLLKDFFMGFDGKPQAILLDPCYRVGDWQPESPSVETCMNGPHLITWDSVCEVGLQNKSWPRE